MLLRLSFCALGGAIVCLGCGSEQAANYKASNNVRSAKVAADAPAAADAQRFRFAEGHAAANVQASQAFFALNGQPPAPADKPAQAVDQKIIYTGTLSVVAKDFDQAEPKVREVVKKHKGYIADAQVQLATKVRSLPRRGSSEFQPKKFDDCMHDLAALGVPESQRVATQDVGEEYVDVQSRITSKKKIEERVLEMLKDRKGDLKEVMELETKLSGIREEIERAQGRLNYLTNRVSYSTINLTLREERDYVPPQTLAFAGQVTETWKTSSGSFMKFLQGVALLGVSIAPWLPVWIVVILLAWLAAKRIHRAAMQTRSAV